MKAKKIGISSLCMIWFMLSGACIMQEISDEYMDGQDAKRDIQDSLLTTLAGNALYNSNELTMQEEILSSMLVQNPIHQPHSRYCRAQVEMCKIIIFSAGSRSNRCQDPNELAICDMLQSAMIAGSCDLKPNHCESGHEQR